MKEKEKNKGWIPALRTQPLMTVGGSGGWTVGLRLQE